MKTALQRAIEEALAKEKGTVASIARAFIIAGDERTHFGSVTAYAEGQPFQSTWERDRYCQLRLLEEGGIIQHLDTQVEFPLVVDGYLVTTYVADFVYDEAGSIIVEDSKSQPTAAKRDYKYKRNLMYICYGVRVLESYADGTFKLAPALTIYRGKARLAARQRLRL
jgi:hypothetical protein